MARNKAEIIKALIRHAREDIRTTEELKSSQRYRQAVSRAYYAAFYAASAMLCAKDVSRTKHSAVEAALLQTFTRTGILTDDMGKKYRFIRRVREKADYDLQFKINGTLCERVITDAIDFVTAAEEYLSSTGFLKEV